MRSGLGLAALALLASCGDVQYEGPETLPDYADAPSPAFHYVDAPADPEPVVQPQHALTLRVGISTAVTAFGYASEPYADLTWLPVNYVSSGDWWTLPPEIPNPPIGPLYVRAIAGVKCYEALIDFEPLVNEGWRLTADDEWEP
jgi:hypothetical protein